MSYQEEEQVSLRRRGSKQAIALAMQGRWGEAVAANKSLIVGGDEIELPPEESPGTGDKANNEE